MRTHIISHTDLEPEQAGRLMILVAMMLAGIGIADVVDDPVSVIVMAIELVVALVVPAGVAVAGIYLLRSDRSATEIEPLVRWWALGSVMFLSPVMWILFHGFIEGNRLVDPLLMVATTTAAGGVFGIAVGWHGLRSREQPTDQQSTNQQQTTQQSVDAHRELTPTDTAETESRKLHAGETPSEQRLRTAQQIHERTQARQEAVVKSLFEMDQRTVSIQRIAEDISDRTGGDLETTMLQLHHHDLPALADTGLLDYDLRQREIVRRETGEWAHE